MIFKNGLKSEYKTPRMGFMDFATFDFKIKNKLTRSKMTSFDKNWTGWSHFAYSPANSTPANSTGFSFPCDVELAGENCIILFKMGI